MVGTEPGRDGTPFRVVVARHRGHVSGRKRSAELRAGGLHFGVGTVPASGLRRQQTGGVQQMVWAGGVADGAGTRPDPGVGKTGAAGVFTGPVSVGPPEGVLGRIHTAGVSAPLAA